MGIQFSYLEWPGKLPPNTIHLHSGSMLYLSAAMRDSQHAWLFGVIAFSPISGLKVGELPPFHYCSMWSDLTCLLLKSNFSFLIHFDLVCQVGNLSQKTAFLPWGSVKRGSKKKRGCVCCCYCQYNAAHKHKIYLELLCF